MKDNLKIVIQFNALFMNNNTKKTEREGEKCVIIFGDFRIY